MSKIVATAIALCIGAASVAAHAQSAGKKQFDPYSQGAKSGQKFDAYTDGAKSGDKFDPYSQGANQSTRADLTDATAPATKKTAKKTKHKAQPAK
jgi:hypothetical protein